MSETPVVLPQLVPLTLGPGFEAAVIHIGMRAQLVTARDAAELARYLTSALIGEFGVAQDDAETLVGGMGEAAPPPAVDSEPDPEPERTLASRSERRGGPPSPVAR